MTGMAVCACGLFLRFNLVLSPHFIETGITEEIAVKKFARKSSFY